MMTVGRIRRENLELLVLEYGTLDEVAGRVGSTPVYLSQLRNRAPDTKTGRPREMGSALARRLEVGCGKPDGWMDTPHSTAAMARAAEGAQPYSDQSDGGDLAGARTPVSGGVRLLPNGGWEPMAAAEATGKLAIAVPDPHAYALRLRGMAMFPALRDGWFLLLAPSRKALEGDHVLLELRDGRRLLQELLYRRSDVLELMSLNGGERLSIEHAEVRSLQVVAALAPPGAWRAD